MIQDVIRKGVDKLLYEMGIRDTEILIFRNELFTYLHSKNVKIQVPNGEDLTGCEIARLLPLIKE